MKKLLIGIGIFSILLPLLLFVAIFISDDDTGNSNMNYGGMNLSEEVLAHRAMVEHYCEQYSISEYVMYILAIMQVESGGKGQDVMQSSESMGLPPNTLQLQESIEQGCKYFSQLLQKSSDNKTDINTVIQSYNYGGGFIDYVANNGYAYTFELAEAFARDKALGIRVSYPNPVAIPINGGWRYSYGNMFYVPLVSQYLVPTKFDDDVVQAVMTEALKYQGFPYVFGGSSPTTSFDCSGLTQWCYKSAGVSLPRTAQQQYDSTTHIPIEEAQAGDLVFFHSTYNSGTYITHVGIYVGNNQMYHAGDPIGYTSIDEPFFKARLVCAGRIKK